ncbi:PIR protein [Plasmodium ovale]|uniref:PIR protein n=1 Tax=Plasmodium ovale TaxID=36330 RepID=A0A1C3KH85_PLAOA|nr:PIR protein [Plasmodium ovale]
MACTYQIKEKYEFFKHIDKYIDYEVLAEKNGIRESSDLVCNFDEYNYVENYLTLCDTCKKFIYLVDLLLNGGASINSNENHVIEYLNYSFNDKLNKIDPENICKKEFFQVLWSQNIGKSNLRKLRSGIYDIAENELKRLNTLYNLYKNFKELNKIINGNNPNEEDWLRYATQCIEEYKKVKDECYLQETQFCKTLKSFKEKYEEKDLCKYNLVKWNKEKLPPLTDEEVASVKVCNTPQNTESGLQEQTDKGKHMKDEVSKDIDVQSITIGSVATFGITFILFILYKFTSFGQFLRYQMNKKESIWENVDEKMNNLSYISDYEHKNSGNMSYNVAYNSL